MILFGPVNQPEYASEIEGTAEYISEHSTYIDEQVSPVLYLSENTSILNQDDSAFETSSEKQYGWHCPRTSTRGNWSGGTPWFHG